MSTSCTAMSSGSRMPRQHSLEELFHFGLNLHLRVSQFTVKGKSTDQVTRNTMNCFGSDFSKFPEDVSLLNACSPLSLSLIAPEDEHFISKLRSQTPAQAVMTQPARGARGRTTVTTIVQTGGDWSTGLLSVCRDRRICFCGLFCPLCLECDIARHYGECICWPLLPGSTFALRVGTRERHNIWGTLCEDWLAVHCCWPLSLCQLARELKMRTSQLYEISATPSAKDTFI